MAVVAGVRLRVHPDQRTRRQKDAGLGTVGAGPPPAATWCTVPSVDALECRGQIVLLPATVDIDTAAVATVATIRRPNAAVLAATCDNARAVSGGDRNKGTVLAPKLARPLPPLPARTTSQATSTK